MPGVGPRVYRALCERFGGAQGVLGAAPAKLRALLPQHLVADIATAARAQDPAYRRDLAWLEAHADRFLLALGMPGYPETLAQLHDPPPVLVGRGDPGALALPAVAIVGSRGATPGALDRAHLLAHGLGSAGLCIVSGLALGIDGAAHRGALAAGAPTVAVLGCGADRVYPPTHARLAGEVVRGGALVSELPVGTQPRPANFPRRNRIIAGLSLATVVVEAGLRSGALITAQIAAELGREVLAVPGAVDNPLARGCHALLKDGAGLAEEPADVLAALAGRFEPSTIAADMAAAAPSSAPQPADADTARLLACLEGAPAALDEIVARSGLTAPRVSSMLLLLELEGVIATVPGGRFARRSPTRS